MTVSGFRPELIRRAVGGNTKSLADVINCQLEQIDKHCFNGLRDADVLSSLFAISLELERSSLKKAVIDHYHYTFWQCVYHHPYFSFHYPEVLRIAYESNTTSQFITESLLDGYFLFIDINEWILAWSNASIEEMISRNRLRNKEQEYFSLDQTEIGHELCQSGHCFEYFIKNTDEKGFHCLLRETYRNIFAKRGSYGSAKRIETMLLARPEYSEMANQVVTSFVTKMDVNFCSYDFFDEDFYNSAVSMSRASISSLRYPIKLGRVAKGTTSDLINYINKTKSKNTSVTNFMCKMLKTTPFEIMGQSRVNANGKKHCLKAIME